MEWREKETWRRYALSLKSLDSEVIHITVNHIALVWTVTCCYLDVWWARKCSPCSRHFPATNPYCVQGKHPRDHDFQVRGCQRWWFSLSPVWPSIGHCCGTVFVEILSQKFDFSISLLKCSFSNSAETKLLCWGLRICIFTKFSSWFLYFLKCETYWYRELLFIF